MQDEQISPFHFKNYKLLLVKLINLNITIFIMQQSQNITSIVIIIIIIYFMTHRKKIRMLYIHIDIYINNTLILI